MGRRISMQQGDELRSAEPHQPFSSGALYLAVVLAVVAFVGVIWLWIFSSSRMTVDVEFPKEVQVQVDERVLKVNPPSPTPSLSPSPESVPGFDELIP